MILKKILVISPSCFPGTKGDSANYLEMMQGLMRMGIKIVLVCPKQSHSNSFDEEMRKHGAMVIRIPLGPPRLEDLGERQIAVSSVAQLIMFYILELLTSLAVAIESDAKHVIVRHCVLTINLQPLLGILERVLGVVSVADGTLISSSASSGVFHAPKSLLRILGFYESAVVRLYTRYIAETPSQIARITEVGFPESRVILKKIGIDTKKIPVHNLKDIPTNTFGYFGALEKWEPVDHLLKAWAKAIDQKHDAKLFIIGDGSMKGDLKKLANNLQILESTIFLNGVSREVLWAEYFKLFRVVIIPRSSKVYPENASMKLIEALASGKPVIASRVSGIAAMVNEKDGVAFAEPDDEGSLALAIIRLLDDDQTIFALSRQALEAAPRFSVDSQLEELVEMLACAAAFRQDQ